MSFFFGFVDMTTTDDERNQKFTDFLLLLTAKISHMNVIKRNFFFLLQLLIQKTANEQQIQGY
jgi:hypothetical protein